MIRTVAILAVIVLVMMPVGAGLAHVTGASSPKVVEHDFTSEKAILTFNETGEVSSIVENTEVRIVDSGPFLRVETSNPNGYGVELDIQIDREIVLPSDLGTIDSVDETSTASWGTYQNFTTGERYTVVSTTLEAGDETAFAPSEVRTLALSWTSEAKGWFGSLRSDGNESEPTLDENTYKFVGNTGESVRVDLSKDDQVVSEWFAEYRIQDGRWQPVEKDSSKPVFVRESEGSLEFVFNEPATVIFVANPSMTQSVGHRVSSYINGWTALDDVVSGLFGVSYPA